MDKTMLSKNQLTILEFIRRYNEKHHMSPTVRDICAGTGLRSTSTVHSNLRFLADNGFVFYIKGARRAITLCENQNTEKADNILHIPLVGNVAAGVPILAVDNIQEYYNIPSGLVHGTSSGDVFMLRIQGDSMIDAGILNNDFIIVNSSESIVNGDIAVARIDDSVTVKRFFLEDDTIRLQPENTTMQPIYAQPEDVELVGKVVGLIRNF